ncbi:hypothetical protein [Sneathiella sp.]|uniref:hypothetical protein n=1 Tax=Sneathiella sp. TaxID=1964365 RepID=UPI002FE290BF
MAQQNIALPVQQRAATILPDSIREGEHTVDVVWSTGAEVRRYDWERDSFFYEELEVSDKAVRMGRMNNFASVLDSHHSWSLESVIGVVQRAWIEKGQAMATLLIDTTTDEGEKNWRRIVGGFIRHISVGYAVHEFVERREAEKRVLRATDWEPLEISFVPIGADAGAGVRSHDHKAELPCKIVRIGDDMADKIQSRQADDKVEDPAIAAGSNPEGASQEAQQGDAPAENASQRTVINHASEILEICDLAGADIRTARDFIARGLDPQDVRTALVDRRSQNANESISNVHSPDGGKRQAAKLDINGIYQRINGQGANYGKS